MSQHYVYVDYKWAGEPMYWTYRQRMWGWNWVGGGGWVTGKRGKYDRDEQFVGPSDTLSDVEAYLLKFFRTLQEKGIISKFQIRSRRV